MYTIYKVEAVYPDCQGREPDYSNPTLQVETAGEFTTELEARRFLQSLEALDWDQYERGDWDAETLSTSENGPFAVGCQETGIDEAWFMFPGTGHDLVLTFNSSQDVLYPIGYVGCHLASHSAKEEA